MFFDTSSGIEPQFALAYTKQDKDGHTYRYVNRYLEKALKDAGIYTDEIMDKVIAEGTLVGIDGVPQDIKEVFRVAMDISPENHIKAQAAFQKYVENSISKTINFPNEATIEDIKGGYILAWQSGCKGCTLYRDGSREIQVLNLNKNLAKAKSLAPGKENQSINSGLTGSDAVKTADKGIDPIVKLDIKVQPQVGQGIVPRQRPDVMAGVTYKLKTPYGNMYVTINQDANGPFEIFSQLGKAGGFFQAQSEAICRMISLALRTGIDVEEIIDQLKGIRGPDVTFANGVTTYSLPDAIGRALENHINKSQATLGLDFDINSQDTQTLEMPLPSKPVTNTNKSNIADLGHAPVCPDCASMLTLGEGCFKCNFCGYSKC
jgi:ribonucleoside-diphosphate reductase alpha chain